MEIRRAVIKDIDQILILLKQILEIHASIRPDIFNSGVTKYKYDELEKMFSDDNNPIFVAVINDVVVGYAFTQIKVHDSNHLIKKFKSMFIDDFCVDEKYRRQHIGEKLFDYIKDIAIKLECDEITLHCWVGNESADKFYEKMGFKNRSVIKEYKLR